MAQRTEVSARDTALDELDDITAGYGEDTAPVEVTEGATPPDGAETPADDAAPDEPEGIEPEPEAPPAPEPPVAWQPPEGGQPFRFRADHREVEVPGALEYDHGIYVPKDAWNTVVSRHLADRDQFQRELQARDRTIEERDPEKHPQILEARVTLEKFRELLDKGPEKMAEWLDNYAVNRPLLEAQIEKEALAAQIKSLTERTSTADQEARAAQVAAELPGYVEQHIQAAISQIPGLSELKGSEKKLVESLWPYARSFLTENAQGQIAVRPDILNQLLKQEADRRSEIKRLEEAGKYNRAATARATPPKTVPARGRPTPGGPAVTFKPGQSREAKDAFLEWNPELD